MYELVQFESSNFVFCVTATAVLEKDYLSIFRSRDRRYRHTDRGTQTETDTHNNIQLTGCSRLIVVFC